MGYDPVGIVGGYQNPGGRPMYFTRGPRPIGTALPDAIRRTTMYAEARSVADLCQRAMGNESVTGNVCPRFKVRPHPSE